MKQYRLYPLNKRSRIIGSPYIIQAETDEDAIAEAKRFPRGFDLELREDARVTTTLKAGTL